MLRLSYLSELKNKDFGFWVLKINKPWEVTDFSATGARERPIKHLSAGHRRFG